MAMKLRTVSVTERQDAFLKSEAKRINISVADLIRRIIDEHLERKEQQK